jgi:hypothetical protein
MEGQPAWTDFSSRLDPAAQGRIVRMRFSDITAAPDGGLLGVDDAGSIWRYPGELPAPVPTAWTKINGNLATVAEADRQTVWGVRPDGRLVCSLSESETGD